MRNPFRRTPKPTPDPYGRLRLLAGELETADPKKAKEIRDGIAKAEWLASLSNDELVALATERVAIDQRALAEWLL